MPLRRRSSLSQRRHVIAQPTHHQQNILHLAPPAASASVPVAGLTFPPLHHLHPMRLLPPLIHNTANTHRVPVAELPFPPHLAFRALSDYRHPIRLLPPLAHNSAGEGAGDKRKQMSTWPSCPALSTTCLDDCSLQSTPCHPQYTPPLTHTLAAPPGLPGAVHHLPQHQPCQAAPPVARQHTLRVEVGREAIRMEQHSVVRLCEPSLHTCWPVAGQHSLEGRVRRRSGKEQYSTVVCETSRAMPVTGRADPGLQSPSRTAA